MLTVHAQNRGLQQLRNGHERKGNAPRLVEDGGNHPVLAYISSMKILRLHRKYKRCR